MTTEPGCLSQVMFAYLHDWLRVKMTEIISKSHKIQSKIKKKKHNDDFDHWQHQKIFFPVDSFIFKSFPSENEMSSSVLM